MKSVSHLTGLVMCAVIVALLFRLSFLRPWWKLLYYGYRWYILGYLAVLGLNIHWLFSLIYTALGSRFQMTRPGLKVAMIDREFREGEMRFER